MRRISAVDATATQTPSPIATDSGWSPTSTVATTRFVAGSIRITVPSRLFTTQTWSAAAAIEDGPVADVDAVDGRPGLADRP